MQAKRNLSDFAASIARKTGMSTPVVRSFLASVGPVIEDGLKADGVVRIAGLGTFRLASMEPRKSVDVSTGRDITIEGYTKVTFTPETAVKALINAPFAHFQPVEVSDDARVQPASETVDTEAVGESQDEEATSLSQAGQAEAGVQADAWSEDPLARLNEQAEEIKDILAEINAVGTASATEAQQAEAVGQPDTADGVGAEPADAGMAASSADSEAAAAGDDSVVAESGEKGSGASDGYEEVMAEAVAAGAAEESEAAEAVAAPAESAESAEAAPALPDGHHDAESQEPSAENEASQPVAPVPGQPAGFVGEATEGPAVSGAAMLSRAQTSVGGNPKPEKQHKSWSWWRWALTIVLVFVALFILLYVFMQYKIAEWTKSYIDGATQTSVAPAEPGEPLPTVRADSVPVRIEQPDTLAEDFEPDEPAASSRAYTEFVATETIGEGIRLVWLAKKHYGAKEFWVYIYEANRDVIRNPDQIAIGTRVRIPKLSPELADPDNPDCIRRARQLESTYSGR